eukprot:359531-Prymnesium_polylepis.2
MDTTDATAAGASWELMAYWWGLSQARRLPSPSAPPAPTPGRRPPVARSSLPHAPPVSCHHPSPLTPSTPIPSTAHVRGTVARARGE